jgi:acyl-CoA thioesterase
MGQFRTVGEAREYFKGDTFAMTNGITIDELTDDGCVCSMEIRDDHRNAMGGIMGGVIFTLADFAMAVTNNNLHRPTVAMDMNISFLSSSKGKHLTASAKWIKDGKSTTVCSILITDEFGKKVSLVTGTGFKL